MNELFFDDRFEQEYDSQIYLPFFHSCDAFYFRNILLERAISPRRCSIFKDEELLYLFYGKPAYKSSNTKSSGLSSFSPTALILKSETINDFKRIAPFDTGAFHLGLYKEYLHSGMQLDNFFLTPRKEAIRKTISYFFTTNERYYLSKPREGIHFDPMHFEIEAYYELIKASGQSKTDDRKTSIEVQLTKEIPLTPETIEAVIIGTDLLQSKMIEDIIIKELKADIITYESFAVPSNHYYTQLLSETKKYMVKKKYLNGE